MRKIFASLGLLIGLVGPICVNNTAQAQVFGGAKNEACAAVNATDAAGKCDKDTLKDSQDKLNTTIKNAIDLLSVVIGIIAVIMITLGGFRFVTADGDSNRVTSARNTIIYAIIGLIIVAFAQIIVKLVLLKI